MFRAPTNTPPPPAPRGGPGPATLMAEMTETEAAVLAIGAIFALGFVILTLPTGLFFGWLAKKYEVAR